MLSCAKQILENSDSVGRRLGGMLGESLAERSLFKLAVRPIVHGERFFALKCSRSKVQIRRQIGDEA